MCVPCAAAGPACGVREWGSGMVTTVDPLGADGVGKAGVRVTRGSGGADGRRHRLFHRPVVVQTGRLDRERVIASTRDAAAVLLKDWPLPDSRMRARAMAACLGVIRGEKPPYVARRAFVAAAREAKVLVGD